MFQARKKNTKNKFPIANGIFGAIREEKDFPGKFRKDRKFIYRKLFIFVPFFHVLGNARHYGGKIRMRGIHAQIVVFAIVPHLAVK